MRLIKEFTFDAAHYLPSYHGKCEELHGHTYRLRVTLAGQPDAEGMIMDFVRLKQLVQEQVLQQLDHHLLNDVLPNPSAETLAVWIWQRLEKLVQQPNCRLFEIQVWETATSGIILRDEDMYVP